MGAPYGLDFGAIVAVAEGMGAQTELLCEALPSVEAAMLDAFHGEGGD